MDHNYDRTRYHSRHSPSREQVQEWRDRLASEENAVDWLWRYVAPDMAQRRRARTCALLMAASGLDRNGFRGRSHCLLYDDQTGGTGKSALGDWIKYRLPDALGVGPDSSEAGLKFNANAGKPGKLAMAHEGILRIEEFEKFDRSDRQATLEAMSEGLFEVDKGGINTEFPAETRVIALTNDIDRLSNPLQTRFDFQIEMEGYSADETISVAHTLQDNFRERYVNREPAGDDGDPILSYLNWVWPVDPALPDPVNSEIREGYERLVREADKTGEIRTKEGYLRTTYTIARLNRRDIRFGDWLRAVDLMEPEVDVAALFDVQA